MWTQPSAPEDVQFVARQTGESIERIRANYPDAGLQQAFLAVIERTRPGGEVHSQLWTTDGQGAFAASHLIDGQPVLGLFVGKWIQFLSTPGLFPDQIDDQMMFVILHENFHLQHHVMTQTPPLIAESEAWADSIINVIRPMRRIGRARGLNEAIFMDDQFKACGDSVTNPRWLELMRSNE